jgi:hypothetical protein
VAVLVHTLALTMKRLAGREVKRSASRAQGHEAETLRPFSLLALTNFLWAILLVSCHGSNSGHADEPSNGRSLATGDTVSKAFPDEPPADEQGREATPDRDQLKERILERGDTMAYRRLRTQYVHMPPDAFLFWALIMANKYDHVPAYCDVYYSIVEAYGCQDHDLRTMDPKTRKLALDYLKTAERKGSEEARSILSEVKE